MSEKLKWMPVAVPSLPEGMQKKLQKAMDSRKQAAADFAAFKADFVAKATKDGKVPAGKELVVMIGRGGKLIAAYADPKEASKRSSEADFSF